MDSALRVILTLGILVMLVAGLYVFSDWFSKTTGYVLGEDQQIRFVQCLGEKQTVLYLKDDCVDCFRQGEIFAENAFDLLDVAYCDELDCSNLKSLPAWEISGKLYYGKKDFKELSEISGCKLE